jgi:hypothetical protein
VKSVCELKWTRAKYGRGAHERQHVQLSRRLRLTLDEVTLLWSSLTDKRLQHGGRNEYRQSNHCQAVEASARVRSLKLAIGDPPKIGRPEGA